MANRKSNWPTAQQPDVEPGEMSKAVALMNSIRDRTRPKTDDELEQRVGEFFQWCADSDVRPGVELLALSLGTTRQTLLTWQKNGGRRADIITQAKQVIAALLENWGQNGKINPAAFCFLMKNNFGYADSVTIEAVRHEDAVPTLEQIEQRRQERIAQGAPDQLPVGDF